MSAVDNKSLLKLLEEGSKRLGMSLDADLCGRLIWFVEELLRWNQKVNLTAITAPSEVVEKHLLDSLAVLPAVGSARSLLDLGSGAGLPGVPLALSNPELAVTLVDAVAKKVGFIKHALANLGLTPRCRAVHSRLEGSPVREGLERAEVVISRAFREPAAWLDLADAYVVPEGRVIAMLGNLVQREKLEEAAVDRGFTLGEVQTFVLPFSGSRRAVAVFRRR